MDDSQEQLLDLLHAVLRDHPDGLTEYELLHRLKEMGWPLFAELDFSDRLALFRVHFLLFHLLYRLRDRLEGDRRESVDIHCLKIALRPWRRRSTTLPCRPDHLGRYYRDLSQMEEMTAPELESMLDKFRQRWGSFNHRSQCLAILDLTEPASRDDIKQRFRQLALRHHPDLGGDPDRFRLLHRAAAILLKEE